MSDDELEAYLRDKLETDLLTLAPHVDPERGLMILATRDDAVPYEKQQELREALGSPEAIVLPSGHVTAAVYLLYLRSRALTFFDRTLVPGDLRSVAELPHVRCVTSVKGI
jgi:hypothetical protein